MALTKDELVEAIKSMSVMELSELSKTLQEVFGVSAAAPMAAAAAPTGAGGEAAAVVEEVTSFDVILMAAGEKRLGVIKVIREITGLGLKESKDMVEAVPAKIKQGANADEAKAVKEKLEGEGATVEIKPAG